MLKSITLSIYFVITCCAIENMSLVVARVVLQNTNRPFSRCVLRGSSRDPARKISDKQTCDCYMYTICTAMKDKTDDGKKFYDVWFILEGQDVNKCSVLKARCICKGGRDGGCKHISAAMYSLEDLLNTRSENSVTGGTCRWLKRSTSSRKHCEVKHLKIAKRNPSLKRKRKNAHAYCENIDIDVRHVDDRSGPTHESQLYCLRSRCHANLSQNHL